MKIDANGTEIRVMGDVVNEDAKSTILILNLSNSIGLKQSRVTTHLH
jgi:hypothetical protein